MRGCSVQIEVVSPALVDTLGPLLAVYITKADVPEPEGAKRFLGKALGVLVGLVVYSASWQMTIKTIKE